RTDGERHVNAVAGVEAAAAHLREVPVGPEVAGTPFDVRLEAAAGENDAAPGLDVLGLAVDAHAHPRHAVIVGDQRQGAGVVEDLAAVALDAGRERIDEPRAAAPGFHRQAAPELELA